MKIHGGEKRAIFQGDYLPVFFNLTANAFEGPSTLTAFPHFPHIILSISQKMWSHHQMRPLKHFIKYIKRGGQRQELNLNNKLKSLLIL